MEKAQLPENTVETAQINIVVGESMDTDSLYLAYAHEGSIETIIYALEKFKSLLLTRG